MTEPHRPRVLPPLGRLPRLLRLPCQRHRVTAARPAGKVAWVPAQRCPDCRIVWAPGEGPHVARDPGDAPPGDAQPRGRV